MVLFKYEYRFSRFLFTRIESSLMKQETIQYKGKSLIKSTKSDGSSTYTKRGVYLGIDIKTGKKITTSITARTLKEFDRKCRDAKLNFEQNGNTQKERVQISNFTDLAEFWFSSYHTLVSSENTLNRVRGYVYNYIIPYWGDYKPDQIEPSDVQIWLNTMANNAREAINFDKSDKKGKAQDFGAVFHKFSDIFDYGITNFALTKNPTSTIKVPPKPKKGDERVKVLSDVELAKWLKFMNHLPDNRTNARFKLINDCLLQGGMRINELTALEISDILVETSEISISKTLMWKNNNKKLGIKGKVIRKSTPKSDSGNRKISMTSEIIERLIEWHNYMNSYFKKHGLPESKLIFPTISGEFMCDRNERTTLIKRLRACGLPEYGFHIFRHTHASILLNQGANWKEIQVRMGHKSISTTMDLYSHLAPKKKAEAVGLILQKLNELSA